MCNNSSPNKDNVNMIWPNNLDLFPLLLCNCSFPSMIGCILYHLVTGPDLVVLGCAILQNRLMYVLSSSNYQSSHYFLVFLFLKSSVIYYLGVLKLGLFGTLKLALVLQFIVTNAYFSVARTLTLVLHATLK